MSRKTLFLILLSFLIVPGIVLAQVTIYGVVNNVVKVVIFVAGGIVIIIWAITGVLFLSSRGDPSKLTATKSALFAAIAGTILVILAISAESIISNIIFKGV